MGKEKKIFRIQYLSYWVSFNIILILLLVILLEENYFVFNLMEIKLLILICLLI